jgi:hypothetical protein
MFDIRSCNQAIYRIKNYILNKTTVTDDDLCLLYPNLEGQYTIFNCDIEQMTKLMNENA